MKTFVSLVPAALLVAGSALANDTMDAMIGKTVVYAYDDGTVVKAKYAADGTYETDVAGGGTWSVDGDTLCITTAGGESGCTALAGGHGPGDNWKGTDAFGNPVSISIE